MEYVSDVHVINLGAVLTEVQLDQEKLDSCKLYFD